MKVKIILLIILLLLVADSQCRRRLRGGRSSGGDTGSYLGKSVVNIINFFREDPVPMGKDYKREYDRPVKEEYTMMWKIKNGLKNFLYLGYAIGLLILGFGGWKLYKILAIYYYKNKLAGMPRNNIRDLDEYRRIEKQIQWLQGRRNYSPRVPRRT